MYADLRKAQIHTKQKRTEKIKDLFINHTNRTRASGRDLAERNISLNNEYTGG